MNEPRRMQPLNEIQRVNTNRNGRIKRETIPAKFVKSSQTRPKKISTHKIAIL